VLGGAGLANAGVLRMSGSGTLGTAGPVTLFGGTLELNGTTQSITTLTMGEGSAGSTAAVDVGAGDLRLGGNVEYKSTNNTNGPTISGSGFVSLLGDRTFTVGNSTAAVNDLTISANIRNGDGSARSLTKAGTGTMLLSGTNTYTGTTNVSAGTLKVTKVVSLPGQTTLNKIIVASGATLAINVGGAGEFTSTDLTNLLTNSSFTSTSVLGIDTANAVGGTFTFASNFTGTRSLDKLGAGTLVLSGSNNNYTGTTTITAGTLQVNGVVGTGGLITVPTGSTLGVGAGATVSRSVTVTGGLVTLAGTLGAGSTLTLTTGTVNTASASATAATVVLPLKGVTPVFTAPTGQELSVTTKLSQTLSDGSLAITAGTSAFKVTGTNLVNNIDKLTLQGGIDCGDSF
jgi:autotransporter-associated beta strand protein